MSALFSKLGEALGKTYLFAGLLPAAVLLVGWTWYSGGGAKALPILDVLNAEAANQTGVAIAGWIGCGLILFAVRTPCLALFERTPSGKIGRFLVGLQIDRRRRVLQRCEELELEYSAIRWHERGFAADDAKHRLPWMPIPSLSDAIFASTVGRERLVESAQDGYSDRLSSTYADLVTFGVGALFQHIAAWGGSGALSPEIEVELQRWREAVNSASARAIMSELADDSERRWVAAIRRRDSFPVGNRTHPMALGNRIAALDDYAEQRYGMDTGALWSRLWWILPDNARGEVADARLSMEVMINLALVFLLLAVGILTSGIYQCVELFTADGSTCDTMRISSWLLAALLLSLVAYRSTVFAMDTLARKMTTLIDIHRLKLLAALGYPAKTVAEEVAAFKELQGFFAQAIARNPDRKLELKSEPDIGGNDEAVT